MSKTEPDKKVANSHFSWFSMSTGLDISRAVLAILTVLTLHALSFCMNMHFGLWPLIDISLVANITFSFSLALALSAFIFRAIPFLLGLAFDLVFAAIVVLGWVFAMYSSLLKRQFGKGENSITRSMKSRSLLFADELRRMNRSAVRNFVPAPSLAYLRLKNRQQQPIKNQISVAFPYLSQVGSLLSICWIYTGFTVLVVMPAVYLVMIFALGSALRDQRDINNAFAVVSPKGSMDKRIKCFILLRHSTRWLLVSWISALIGSFSIVAGDFRFHELVERNPVTMTEFNGAEFILFQYAMNSSGVFFQDETGKQFFRPFESINSLATTQNPISPLDF